MEEQREIFREFYQEPNSTTAVYVELIVATLASSTRVFSNSDAKTRGDPSRSGRALSDLQEVFVPGQISNDVVSSRSKSLLFQQRTKVCADAFIQSKGHFTQQARHMNTINMATSRLKLCECPSFFQIVYLVVSTAETSSFKRAVRCEHDQYGNVLIEIVRVLISECSL